MFSDKRCRISQTQFTFCNTVFGFILGFQDKEVNLSCEDRVPRFWANSTDYNYVGIANLIVLLIGVCFGAIHCIAWAFSFPAHRVADMAHIECRYNCCPHLCPFDARSGYFTDLDGL